MFLDGLNGYVVYVYLLSFIWVLFLWGYRVGCVFFGEVFVDCVWYYYLFW